MEVAPDTDDPRWRDVAKALADPTRFRILTVIADRREISCGDLGRLFPRVQATISHHVKILVRSGLVMSRRQGQFHYLRLEKPAMEAYARYLLNIGSDAGALPA